MSQVKVSVIIPVYNVEKYLAQCMDSVVNQTLKDIEIICINDGSTDNSLSILEEYAQKDNRIKLINKANSGYGNSMNLGIEQAKGEYIGIVEPDDYIDLKMFETLYNISQVKNAQIVKSNYYSFDENGIKKENKFQNTVSGSLYKNIEIPEFAAKNHPCIWSAIYKNDFLRSNKIQFSNTPGAAFQDIGFNIKSWLFADKIAVTEDAFYYYRVNNSSSSINQGNKMAFVTLNEYRLVYNFIKSHNFDNDLISHIDRKCCQACSFNYNSRLTKGHLQFILGANKLFNSHYNELLLKKSFYRGVKNHPYLYYLTTLIYMEKKKSQSERKYYLFRIPVLTVEKSGRHRVYKALGIKLKIKDKNKALNISQSFNATLLNLFQDRQIEKYVNKPFDIENCLSSVRFSPKYLPVDQKHNFFNILINKDPFTFDGSDEQFENIDDVYFCWEIRPTNEHINIINYALNVNKKVIFVGDSFLRSINTFADKQALPKYQKGISFTLDDLTSYFDATRPSRLEQMLNDKNLILNEEQLFRARKCIDKIVSTHLTKYNSQPIYEPKIGRDGVKKVLVVDQSYNDMSILKGMANDKTFEKMLDSAILENPDADIIVKTHPDIIAAKGRKKGYYSGLKEHDNIYLMTDAINPISLIKYCDKVYVCSTQLGFESLMCGKETHVFGMPFYAGWGLTHDRQKCDRRTNTRSLEELFYIAYIMYSYYVNPRTNSRCEIEEAMDYLLNLRDEYFNIYNIRSDFEDLKDLSYANKRTVDF